MQKYLVQSRLFTSVLKSRHYSSYSIFHILHTKTNTALTDHQRPPKSFSSAYWSLFQGTPCDFRFTPESSRLAIKDAQFMQRLFTHISRCPSNTHSSLISHCYDLYRTLDMPSQLVYLRYLNDHYPQKCVAPFFCQLYQLPGGVKRLVDLRASILAILQHYPCEQPNLSSLEASLKSSLKRWLVPSNGHSGCLSIDRITWELSSPEVIEKLCRYEAVHAVTSLQDIRRRLAPDRRIYALFTRNMPKEPLVFVHVAFAPELSNSIQTILQPSSPMMPHSTNNSDIDNDNLPPNYRYAICYSITTQQGLGGMHLGNYLIRNVVNQLQQSYPQLHTFATLSPIPGFRQWLADQISKNPSIQAQLEIAAGTGRRYPWDQNISSVSKENPLAVTLSRLCARYLLEEKRSNNGALDPVANFHLRNGACVHQLHWMGDKSAKGINESFGLMVNYNYIPSRLDELHQRYMDHGTIFISEQSAQENETTSPRLTEWLGSNVFKIV